MSRTEEIIMLEVQNPLSSPFCANDLKWTRVDGGLNKYDDVALVPFERIHDFIKAKNSNLDSPTNFYISSHHTNIPRSLHKPRIDSFLKYTMYWCYYGPKDYRVEGNILHDESPRPKSGDGSRPRQKHAMRGCLFHFIVKRLYTRSHLALITYNNRHHVDQYNKLCHGIKDNTAGGTQAMFSPHLSNEIKKWVKSMLYLGVPGDVIFDNHTLTMEAKVAIDGKSSHHDDFLTRQDIYNLEASKLSLISLSKEDDSVRGWIQRHHDRVFFYQDMSNNQPFILGIQSTWQLEQMVKFGKNNLIATDSTFGTNNLKYPLFTLIVFDTHQNGVPVAWISHQVVQLMTFKMEKLQSRIHEVDPAWRPSAFMVDDVAVEINGISDVFGCRVLLFLWHVRRSWLNNLTKKCHDYLVRREMFKDLGDIMYNQSHATNIMETI
eukprot:Gb_30458 [translate_table: standard]